MRCKCDVSGRNPSIGCLPRCGEYNIMCPEGQEVVEVQSETDPCCMEKVCVGVENKCSNVVCPKTNKKKKCRKGKKVDLKMFKNGCCIQVVCVKE